MKIIRKIQLSLFLLLVSSFAFGQVCLNFHRIGDCRKDIKHTFRYYSQSRSDLIKYGHSAEYNLIFYGNKEYIVSFCTLKNFYPVHFKLVDELTEQVLYDNKEDDYLESIGFAVENTKMIMIEVEILAYKASDNEIEEQYPCLGMFIQFRESETKESQD